MRISGIDISNYRQYQQIHFSFPHEKEHDLHVIIAQNGIGKTNILNAINWCLYEDEPHLGNQSKTLPKYNLQAKDVAVQEGKSTVTVQVTIYAEDGDESYIFSRKQDIKFERNVELKSQFGVTVKKRTGESECILNPEEVQERINRFIPQNIRQYFFFDGEQLNNYFTANTAEHIRSSIYRISQVDILTRIHERLKKIIRSKEKSLNPADKELQQLLVNLEQDESNYESNKNLIQDYEGQIAQSWRIIEECNRYLIGQEDISDLERRSHELHTRQNLLVKAYDEKKAEIFEFIRKYTVILSFYPAAKSTLEMIFEKESKNLLPPTVDRAMLEEMLLSHRCKVCEHDLSSEDEKRISSLIRNIQISSAASNCLKEIKSDLQTVVTSAGKYKVQKDKLVSELTNIEGQISSVEDEIEAIDKKISSISDKEETRRRIQDRKDHTSLVEKNSGKKANLEKNNEELGKKIENLKQEKDRLIERSAETAHQKHIIQFTTRAKDIISEIEKEMIDEVRTKMANETTKFYTDLIWKKNTYEKVLLTEDYNIDLIHTRGYSCVGSCSGAEKALLALSFTLALHQVSGFEGMLFIDTPVATISDINRRNFSEVLKEVSKSKQIITMFSPNEYSSEVSEVFNGVMSTESYLTTCNEEFTIPKEVR